MLKNVLTRRKESDAYLATVSRHCWSPQIAMKVDKVCSFQPALRPSSSEEEHMVKTAIRWVARQERGKSGGDGWKMKWKLSEVNTRAVSRGQNELIGKLNIFNFITEFSYCNFFFSVAYVSRSGGMSNELNNIVSKATNGVLEGVAIGGDRYPGTNFMDHIMRYQADPKVCYTMQIIFQIVHSSISYKWKIM